MICKYDIEVYDAKDEWAQAKYLVHGYGDVLWTNDIEQVLNFIKQSINWTEKDLKWKKKN